MQHTLGVMPLSEAKLRELGVSRCALWIKEGGPFELMADGGAKRTASHDSIETSSFDI